MSADLQEGFRTQSKNLSVQQIQDMCHTKDLTICPAYKHSFHWDISKQSKFIESLLVNIPVNAFWFEQNQYGAFDVIDGTQRIQALLDYIEGKFALIDMSFLFHIKGLTFEALEYKHQLHLSRKMLPIQVINYDVSPELKCEFYRRYNIGNRKSNSQQARNFAYREAFETLIQSKQALKSQLSFVRKSNNHGFLTILNKEQFYLCLLFIQMLSQRMLIHQQHKSYDCILDFIMQRLDYGESLIDLNFLAHHIQQVLNYRGLKTVSLNYQRTSRPNQPITEYAEELSMNQFLNLFFISAIWGLSEETANKEKMNINFFNSKLQLATIFNKLR